MLAVYARINAGRLLNQVTQPSGAPPLFFKKKIFFHTYHLLHKQNFPHIPLAKLKLKTANVAPIL